MFLKNQTIISQINDKYYKGSKSYKSQVNGLLAILV